MSEHQHRPFVSVVVPIYNSEASLPVLLARLDSTLRACTAAFEIILVNDGSPDRSADVLDNLSLGRPSLRVVHLSRNFGQHNATLCGIRLARYSIVVTIDDDLQNPPEEIPTLLGALTSSLDVVYGRPMHEQHGLWRDLASRVTKQALQTTMGAGTARSVSPFRAFRTRLRDAFADYGSPLVSIDVLLTWGTTRFGSVSVKHDPRFAGRSNYTFRMLVTHALNMVTGFSTVPLQVSSILGFCLTLFGVIVLIFVVGRYLVQGSPVAGFPFLASIVSIFSGAQLFALGIIGEYLARMHFRLMNRPSYVVKRSEGALESETGEVLNG